LETLDVRSLAVNPENPSSLFGGTYYGGLYGLTITCNSVPSITTQPANLSVEPGQTATLSVSATGTGPLAYKWYAVYGASSQVIDGAVSSSYTTPPLTETASYYARVFNACGFVQSDTATVSVTSTCMAPSIAEQPISQSIPSGQSASLSVTANGTAPLAYQWYQGGSGNTTSPIAGATSSAYTTLGLTQSTDYWVRVSNGCGHADSVTVTVTVTATCTAPAVTAQPGSQSILSGQSATLSITATGTAPLSYQWYRGVSGDTGSPISGATSSSITTPGLTQNSSYWVRVSNGCGQADSATAVVSVTAPPIVVSLQKAGSPFRIRVSGSNLRSELQVFVNGAPWSQLSWKSESKLVLKGGATLKAAVPKGTPTEFRFVNPDGGETTVTWQWP
jgi:hypothetical protein